MSGVKISALPAATAANDSDQLEVNQGGTSRRVTVGQLAAVVAPASGPTDVLTFGVLTDGTEQSPANLQAAIDWALADTDSRVLWLAGDVWLSGDVTNFHAVHWSGPGNIRIGTGTKWYVQADEINRGYGGKGFNILYVSAAGSAAASGLAPEFPVPTLQRAFDILGTKPDLQNGYFNISLLEGVHAAGAAATNIDNGRGRPITIYGPTVSVWDNSAPPRLPVAITAITSANPPVVSATAHGYTNGQKVFIGFALAGASAHGSDGRIYTVAGAAANTFQLSGVDGTAWAAYTGSGFVYDANGSAPKAIVYGAGSTAVNGIEIAGRSNIWCNDLHLIGIGTPSTGAVNGIYVSDDALFRSSNVHCSDLQCGIHIRDMALGSVVGGRIYNAQTGFQVIGARVTFGAANPVSAALTTTPIVQKCTFGADIWEMSSGHCDGNIFIDCNAGVYARKNSHMVAIYNRMTNASLSAPTGYTAEDGSFLGLDLTSDVWSGTFKPRYRRLNNATLSDGVTTKRSWQNELNSQTGVTITAAGGEITVMSLAIKKDWMNTAGQRILLQWTYGGTNVTSAITWRVKLGATVLRSYTDAANAAAQLHDAEFLIVIDGFGNFRSKMRKFNLVGAANTVTYDTFSNPFDTTADTTLTVTGDNPSVGDTCVVNVRSIDTLG